MRTKKTAVFFILAFIVVMTILFFAMPKNDFSENENRYLAKFPELTSEAFFSGRYMQDISTYLCDHFPLRNTFMETKTGYEKDVLLSREINGVYIAKDGYYIEKYNSPETTDKIINTLNLFDESVDVPIYLMLVPTAVTVYKDKLPKFAVSDAQEQEMNKIYESTQLNDIDVLSQLSAENEHQLFYRLDHHWTTFGAYEGYKAFCDNLGIKALEENEFDIKEVTDSFKGTVFSKVNDIDAVSDKIYIFDRKSDIKVLYEDSGEEKNTFYNMDYLEQKDKYSMFLDNIHSLIVIENENADTDEEIAVVKDSYANCFIPFLVNHFKKIHVFDTRHYKDSVSEYVTENGINQVLILYNMNTIDTDTGINRIN